MAEQLAFEGFEAPKRKPGPIEQAVVSGDDLAAVNAVLVKCARTMDQSESGRDVKALSVSLFDGIALRRELQGGGAREGGDSAAEVLKFISCRRSERVAGA